MKLIIFILILLFVYFLPRKRNTVYRSYMVKGYTDLQNERSFEVTSGGITKIIIKTSWHKRNSMPLQMIKALEQTKELNPGYSIYYFDNDEVEHFMKDFSNEVYRCYKKLVPGAFKADLFRACCLYRYGGCYSDIGHIPFVPFDDLCGDSNIVLVSDAKIASFLLFEKKDLHFTGIHNALMCTIKEHPFFKAVIAKTCENISNGYYGENSLDITGPMMIGKIFNCYFGNKCNFVNENNLIYGTNDYSCDRCKIKMLRFVGKPYLFKDTYFIEDQDKTLIQTKFNDYYDVMYGSTKTLKYGDLWKLRKVFI